MVDKDYKRAREVAVKELEELLQLQQRTEQRIVNLRNTISSLDALSGASIKKPVTPKLTNAIRSIFKAARDNEYLSPRDVRHGLLVMGFKDSDYSNLLASIHVILKRLVLKDEIEERPGVPGGPGSTYRKKVMEDYLAGI